jgi:hypothetical protein
MIDYDKRDAKVAQKIEQLQNAPLDQVERLLGKALRTLFHLGLQEARRETEYCQSCLGRGYRDHSGIPFGWCIIPPPKETMKAFCSCKRGQELKQNFKKLGDWNNPLFGRPGFNPIPHCDD